MGLHHSEEKLSMYHFFVKPEQIGKNEIIIEGPDVNHIGHVLRMKPGEQVRLCTGEDNKDYRCEISEIEADRVICNICWVEESDIELPSKITLYQGLPKSDKMETVVQKAVELGAYRVVPVDTKRSIVKLDAKKAANKIRRWNAVSESAAKQSKRMIIPEVAELKTFAQALQEASELDCILIPYELSEDMDHTREVIENIKPGQSVGIFIGPEGGFDPAEVQKVLEAGGHAITLGRRILRTETAGMTVLSALMFHLEGKKEPGLVEED